MSSISADKGLVLVSPLLAANAANVEQVHLALGSFEAVCGFGVTFVFFHYEKSVFKIPFFTLFIKKSSKKKVLEIFRK